MYPSDFADLIALLRYIGVTARAIHTLLLLHINSIGRIIHYLYYVHVVQTAKRTKEKPYVQYRSYGTQHTLMAREHPSATL